MVQDAGASHEPWLWDRVAVRSGGAGFELASSTPVSLSVFVLVLCRGYGQRVVWRYVAGSLRGLTFHADRGLLLCSTVSFLRDQRDGHGLFCVVHPLLPGGELGKFLKKKQ